MSDCSEDSKVKRGFVLTLANQLTILRMGLSPVFFLAVVYGYKGWAFAVFVVAGLTDWLDGFIAKYWEQKSVLGTYLDPAADKLLLVTAYIVLTVMELPFTIPLWLTALLFARDVIIMTSVAIMLLTSQEVKMKPSKISKVNTFFQIVTVYAVLFFNWTESLISLGNIGTYTVNILIFATLATILGSGFHYAYLLACFLEGNNKEWK